MSEERDLSDFLNGKTEYTIELFRFFVSECDKISCVQLRVLKSMIAMDAPKTFAYVVQFGKNFIHIVIPFSQAFNDNLCFSKIAQVPGTNQFNHHLRIYFKDDVNEEVKSFIKLAVSNPST